MPSPGLKFIITTLAAPSGPNTFAMLPPDRWSKVFTTSSPRLMIKHNDVVLYTGTVCLSSQLAVSKGPRQYALLALGNGQTAELKTFWRASNSNPQVARVVSASSLVKAPTDYNKAFLRIMIAEGNITTQDVRDIKSRIDPSSKKGTHWPLPLASFIKEEDLQQQSQRLMSPMTITPQNRSAVFLPMGYGSAKQPLWLPLCVLGLTELKSRQYASFCTTSSSGLVVRVLTSRNGKESSIQSIVTAAERTVCVPWRFLKYLPRIIVQKN